MEHVSSFSNVGPILSGNVTTCIENWWFVELVPNHAQEIQLEPVLAILRTIQSDGEKAIIAS